MGGGREIESSTIFIPPKKVGEGLSLLLENDLTEILDDVVKELSLLIIKL